MSKTTVLLNRIRTRRVLVPTAVVVFVLTVVSTSVLVVARLKINLGSHDVSHEPAIVSPSDRRVQIVRFTLYDSGIYPHEARANPGRLTIALEDLTGSGSGLVVERVEGFTRVPAGAVNKAANRLRSRGELNLPAGRYEVIDAMRPENRAVLIIEP
jgi:hypothetical protein